MKRNIFFRENNLQERAYHRLKDYQNFCKQTSCNALKCVKTKGKGTVLKKCVSPYFSYLCIWKL